MANIVIVSNHCYLLAQAINSIHIDISEIDNSLLRDENPSRMVKKGNKKKKNKAQLSLEEFNEKTKALNTYNIIINYMPVNNNTNSLRDEASVQFCVMGYNETVNAYREIVRQIREQIPDQMFLNELVDKLLDGEDDDKDAN